MLEVLGSLLRSKWRLCLEPGCAGRFMEISDARVFVLESAAPNGSAALETCLVAAAVVDLLGGDSLNRARHDRGSRRAIGE